MRWMTGQAVCGWPYLDAARTHHRGAVPVVRQVVERRGGVRRGLLLWAARAQGLTLAHFKAQLEVLRDTSLT